MFKLEFINAKNERVELFSHPYLLYRFEGLGDTGVINQTQKSPFQDGSTLIDSVLEERFPVIELKITAKDELELAKNRRKLSSVFNPKLGEGILRRIADDGTHEISVVAESVPFYPDGVGNRSRTFQKALISLKAPNPYWKSPTIQEEPMAAFVELFEFPSDYWELGEDGDIYFEMGTEGHTRTFVNNGDGAVPIKIRIKGPTLNPTLTNLTTDELIKINRELSADDVLEISTEDGDKYILLNGENVFNWIDLSSTFWKLEVGENEIQYTADAGLESATLEITWQEQFVGV